MDLNLALFEAAVTAEERGETLDLTTAFQTQTAIGGAFAGTGSAAQQRSQTLKRQKIGRASCRERVYGLV